MPDTAAHRAGSTGSPAVRLRPPLPAATRAYLERLASITGGSDDTRLAAAPLPKNTIDGKDITDLMFGKPNAKTPHEVFYHYDGGNRLMALRSGKWKLMMAQMYNSPTRGKRGFPGKVQRKSIELSLFDLESDVGETTNVADQHPQVVARLMRYAEEMRKDLGHGINVGSGRRAIGRP